jgi:hypothetical protein
MLASTLDELDGQDQARDASPLRLLFWIATRLIDFFLWLAKFF